MTTLDSRRKFNRRERFALKAFAGGCCEECGGKLGRNFHADHFVPWIKGGATDVVNGRALCPKCNLQKGSKMIAYKPRRWQINAMLAYHQKTNSPEYEGNFLLHATMGAGKTSLSCQICSDRVRDRTINRIVVVTTSRNLCKTWLKSAHKFGIQLERNWSVLDGKLTSNFHGLVITYAKLCAPGTSEFLREWCAEEPTLVILDEPHHLGDSNETSWGPNARNAFEFAKERLLITGTPWRSDGTPIPFVKYDEDRYVKCDFRYTYSEALSDVVCRFVFFPTMEGSARFALDGVLKTFESLSDVPSTYMSKVLATIFQPDGGWMTETINLAHKELMEMRANGHPDAGGLIVVSGTDEATRVARHLRSLTHSEVLVVTSKEEDSEKLIERFRDGTAPWLVAVQMVSEGEDIPRLRVGIYATNVRTRLAFRQFIGRFVRVIEGMEDQAATIFIPRIEPYLTFAREIEAENIEALADIPTEPKKPRNEEQTEHTFTGIGSTGEHKETIAGPIEFSAEEEKFAYAHAQACGLGSRITSKEAARLLRQATGAPLGGTSAPPASQPPQDDPDSELREVRRKECAKLQRRLAFVRYGDGATSPQFRATGREIIAHFGKKPTKANPEMLERIIDWLLKEIHEGRRA